MGGEVEVKTAFWYDSRTIFAVVAQLVEHIHGKDEVTGSIPVNGSMGRYRSGQTGQTVNLLAHAFEGSNPSLPTTKNF